MAKQNLHDTFLLGELRTHELAQYLETFLNIGMGIGVTAEWAHLYLYQQEAESPYSAAFIEQLRRLVASVNKLDGRLQRHIEDHS